MNFSFIFSPGQQEKRPGRGDAPFLSEDISQLVDFLLWYMSGAEADVWTSFKPLNDC